MSDYPFLKNKEQKPSYPFLTDKKQEPKQQSPDSYGDSFVDNLREGFVQGGKGMVGSGAKYIGDVAEKITDASWTQDLEKWGEEYAKDVPAPDGSAGQFIGSLFPSIIPAVASIAAAPVVGPAAAISLGTTAAVGMGISSAGQGMIEYEDYKKSRGEEINELEKHGVALAYGAAEIIMERIGLGRLTPNISKFVGHPEKAIEASKEMLAAFRKSQPSKAKTILKNIAKGAGTEGFEESMTELAQSMADNWYRETEDKFGWEQIAERMAMAAAGGALMGSGLGQFSYAAQNKMHSDRRKKQGSVILAEVGGQAEEVVSKKGDEGQEVYTTLDATGKTHERKADEVSNVFTLPTDQFYNVLKGKVQETDAFEQEEARRYNESRDQVINIFENEIRPTAIDVNGQNLILRARYKNTQGVVTGKTNDAAVFQPTDELGVPQGQPQAVSWKEIQETVEPIDVEQMREAMVPPELSNEEFINPTRGESFSVQGSTYTVTGFDQDSQTVAVEDEDGEIQMISKQDYLGLKSQPQQPTQEKVNINNLFDEEGNVSITTGKETGETREIQIDGSPTLIYKQEDGSYRANFASQVKKDADAYAKKIKEAYPKLTVKIVDVSDQEDGFSPQDFRISISNKKETDGKSKKATKSAKEGQRSQRVSTTSQPGNIKGDGVGSDQLITGNEDGGVDGVRSRTRGLQTSSDGTQGEVVVEGPGEQQDTPGSGTGLEQDLGGEQSDQSGENIPTQRIPKGVQESEVSQKNQEGTQEGDGSEVSTGEGTVVSEETSSETSGSIESNTGDTGAGGPVDGDLEDGATTSRVNEGGDVSGTNESIEIKDILDQQFNISGKYPNKGISFTKGIKEMITEEEYKGKKLSKGIIKDAELLLNALLEGDTETISKISKKYFSEWSKQSSFSGTQRERYVPINTAKVELHTKALAASQFLSNYENNQQQQPEGSSKESVGGSRKAKSADGKSSRSTNKNTGRGGKKNRKGNARKAKKLSELSKKDTEKVQSIVEEYNSERLDMPHLTQIEKTIYSLGPFKVNQGSFNRTNDKNNVTATMAKSYFKKGASSLDQIAMELSEEGVEVTPEDVAEFMIKYPEGVDSSKVKISPRGRELEQDYYEIMGKNINVRTAKQIAEKLGFSEKKINDVISSLETKYFDWGTGLTNFDELYSDLENGDLSGLNLNENEEAELTKRLEERAAQQEAEIERSRQSGDELDSGRIDVDDLPFQKVRGTGDLFSGMQTPDRGAPTRRDELKSKMTAASKRLIELNALPTPAKSNLVREEIDALKKEINRLNEQLDSTLNRDKATAGGEQQALFQRRFQKSLFQYLPEVTLDGLEETNYVTKQVMGSFYPLRKQQVEAEVKKVMKGWKNGPQVKVWESVLDFQNYYESLTGQLIDNPYSIAGMYWSGDNMIHLVSSHQKFRDKGSLFASVQNTILHEAVGHHGLRNMVKSTGLQEEFDGLMDEVVKSFKNDSRIDAITRNYFDKSLSDLSPEDQRAIAEEFIAHTAETNIDATLQDKIITFLRKLFRELTGSHLKMNDAEIRSLINNSRRFVEVGQNNYVPRIPRNNARFQKVTQPKQNLKIYGQRPGEAKPPREGVRASGARFQKVVVDKKTFGAGHTDGIFQGEDGKLYKSLRTYYEKPNHSGVELSWKRTFVGLSEEYDILSRLQGDPSFPVIGDLVDTNHGQAFEIEPLKEVKSISLSEANKLEKVFAKLSDARVLYEDIPLIMKRGNELVLADFSTAKFIEEGSILSRELKGQSTHMVGLLDSIIKPSDKDAFKSWREVEYEKAMKELWGGEARFQKAPPTDSEAFKKWFKDSKVVDENGEPLVVYHGTSADFNEFDLGLKTKNFKQSTLGIYMSSEPMYSPLKGIAGTTASEYAQNAQPDGYASLSGANVMPVYVSIQNPFILKTDELGSPNVFLDSYRNTIKEEIEGKDYDGIIAYNENPEENGIGMTIVAFSPTQIKSATGNQGTFDGNNPDIRFQKQKIRSEISDYIKEHSQDPFDVKVRDWNGKVVFHGTSKTFADDISTEGIDMSKSARGYFGRAFYTTPNANLAIDNYADFSDEDDIPGMVIMKIKPDANIMDLRDEKDWDTWRKIDGARLVSMPNSDELFRNKGIDGVYDNSFEGVAIYNPDAVDIEKTASGDELRFQVKKPIEETKDLVALHNISAGGILNADKIGGLPMPSIAITRKDLQFTSFGDVSLVADKRLIDPKVFGNRTFGADVYSPRYPSVNYFPNEKQINNRFAKYEEDMPKDWKSGTSKLIQDIEDNGVARAMWSPIVKAAYLKESGKSLPKLKVEPKPFVTKEILEYYKKKQAEDNQWTYHDYKFDEEFKRLASENAVESIINNGETNEEVISHYRELFSDPQPHILTSTIKEIEKNLNGKKEYKTSEWFNELDSRVGYTGTIKGKRFEKWARDQFDQIDIDEKIFKGFTYSGNRQWLPHNIESVMKMLKKDVRAGEGFGYGVGTARAAYTPQFRSIEQIRKSKDLLVSEEQFEKIKEEVNDELFEIADLYPKSGSDFGHADRVVSFLVDAGKNGFHKELREYGFDGISRETIERTQEFIQKLRNFPTEYFESKPNRAVRLYEFKAAIVPKKIDPKAEQVLKNQGLPIIKYDAKKEGDRTEKLNKFLDKNPDIRFQKLEEFKEVAKNSPNFYSNSLQSIANINQSKATAEQWKAMLLKNGASQAELDWIGFDEEFKGKKPTKEEVYDFIESKDLLAQDNRDSVTFFNKQDEPVENVPYTIDGNVLKVDELSKNTIKWAVENNISLIEVKGEERVIDEIEKHKALSTTYPLFQKVTTVSEDPIIESFKMDNTRLAIQDRYLLMKRLQESKLGSEIDDALNAYQYENLSKGIANDLLDKFKNDHITPIEKLITKMFKQGISYDETQRYLKARHIVDDNIEEGGIPIEEARKIIRDFKKKADYQDVANLERMTQDINQFVLQRNYETGLISKETLDKYQAQYKFYVPLRGFANAMEFDTTVYTRDVARKGRTSESGDPLPYLYAMAQTAIQKGQQNLVKQRFLNFVKAVPDSRLYTIKNVWYSNQNGEWILHTQKPSQEIFDKFEVKRNVPVDGMTEQEFADFRTKNAFSKDSVSVMVEGKKIVIEGIGEGQRIMRSINNADIDKTPKLLNYLGTYTRRLTKFYTQYSPEFAIRNLIRDMTTGLINVRNDRGSKAAMKVFAEVPKSMNTIRKFVFNENKKVSKEDERIWREYVENGGLTGYSDLKDVADYARQMDQSIDRLKGNVTSWSMEQLEHLLKPIDQINRVFENTVRFSAYKIERQRGRTPEQAAMYAKDLTVNFNRKGNWSNTLSTLYLFFNASTQGIERLVRPFGFGVKNPSPEQKKTRLRAYQSMAMLGSIGLALQVFNRVLGGQDEDDEYYYDKLPSYTRTHNIVIPKAAFGGKEGEFWQIPLPYGYNVFFAVPDHFMQGVMGKEKPHEVALGTFAVMSESFSPLGSPDFSGNAAQGAIQYGTPTIARPILDLAFNKNFAGNPIYREPLLPGDTPRPDSQMYYKSVNPGIKWITDQLNTLTGGDEQVGGWIDINPEWVEHLISGYGGGAFHFIDNAITTGINVVFEGPRETVTDSDLKRRIPFVRNYQTGVSSYYNQGTFYDNVREVKAYSDIYKRYLKTDRRRAIEYRRENLDKIKLASIAENYDKKVRSLSDRKKRIEKAGRPTDAIDEKLDLLYTDFNSLYNGKKKPSFIRSILGI